MAESAKTGRFWRSPSLNGSFLAEAAKMGMERLVISGLGQNLPDPPKGLSLVKVSRVGELQKVLF